MEENIDIDMEEMGEKKEYKCSQCEAKYSCRQNLYHHQLQCLKQKKIICDLCEKVFDRIDVMKRHKINCKGKVNLRCEVCELDFTRSSNLKRHVERIHNCDNKDTDLICPHCKKKYKRPSFLKEHIPKCKAELEPNPKKRSQMEQRKKEVLWSI